MSPSEAGSAAAATSLPQEEAAGALRRLHALCDVLRSGLDESIKLKQSSSNGVQSRIVLSDASLSLLELREVNRTVQEAITTLKGKSASANGEVDAADLKLQNLQYEKGYFLREIRQARDYPPDRPIDMLEKAAFVKTKEAAACGPEASDPHAFHLARLTLELDNRRQLCEKRDKLLASRKQLEESIASRRAFLEGMGAQLASITRISMPLQDLLQQRLTSRWQESRHIKLLPAPLQLLFERALAHRDTTLKALQVSVEGDVELAASLAADSSGGKAGAVRGLPPTPGSSSKQAAKRKKGSGADGGAAEETVDAAADADAAAEAEEVDEALRLHPLRLHIVLPLPPPPSALSAPAAAEGGRTLVLDFCCMTAQGMIAVAVSNEAPAAARAPSATAPPPSVGPSMHGANAVSGDAGVKVTTKLLVNLLESDTGDELPPTGGGAPPLTAAQQREALLTLLPAVPYRWAQLLGSDPEAIGRFDEVLERITERVRAADAIALQLARLSALDVTLPAHLATPLPSPPAPAVSVLKAWRQLDYENDLSADARARLPTVRASQRIFHAELTRGSVSLGVTVCLFADFPRSAAHLSLDWIQPPARFAAGAKGPPAALEALASPAAVRVAKLHRAATRDVGLMQMEVELNRPSEPPAELMQADGIYSLSFAIQRAVTLLDAYVETDGEGGGATAIRGTLCSRRVRGRDRRRPFVFDAKSGQFDQAAQRSKEAE